MVHDVVEKIQFTQDKIKERNVFWEYHGSVSIEHEKKAYTCVAFPGSMTRLNDYNGTIIVLSYWEVLALSRHAKPRENLASPPSHPS